ncbi:MAG TPA: PDZ domain-containing protein [Vicinamibacterales bacterium]|jgi:serine protease Do|nr:PDZ domain-containing protein [Vicinamibacterales bacterium]
MRRLSLTLPTIIFVCAVIGVTARRLSGVTSLPSGQSNVRGTLGLSYWGPPLLNSEAAELSLPTAHGAMITHVRPGGPADKAGLQVEDVIVAFNGQSVTDGHSFALLLSAAPIDATVPLTVIRRGSAIDTSIDVEASPSVVASTGPMYRLIGPEAWGVDSTGFGLRLATSPGTNGSSLIQVTDLLLDGIAQRIGIRGGDIIANLDDVPVKNLDAVLANLRAVSSGGSVRVRVIRQGAPWVFFLRRP